MALALRALAAFAESRFDQQSYGGSITSVCKSISRDSYTLLLASVSLGVHTHTHTHLHENIHTHKIKTEFGGQKKAKLLEIRKTEIWTLDS